MPRSLQRLKQAQQRTQQVLSERPAKRRKVTQGNPSVPESAGPTRAQEEPAEELLPQQEAPPAREQAQQPENTHVPPKKHKPADARKRLAAGNEPPKASSKSFIKQRKLRRKDRQLEARALERDGELPQEAVPFGEQALQPIKVRPHGSFVGTPARGAAPAGNEPQGASPASHQGEVVWCIHTEAC